MSWHRTLSGALALTYVLIAFGFGGAGEALKMGVAVLFPLACIWFDDEMGQCTGVMGVHGITYPAPGAFVRFGGWLVLLLPLVIVPALYVRRH